MNIIIIIAVAALAALVGFYLAKKFGVKGETILEDADKALGYGESLADAIAPFVPGIPVATIKSVLTAAQKAVQAEEATYKAQLAVNANAPDTRKTAATTLIQSALALDGIKTDSSVNKLISVAIDALVLALPKTHTVAAAK